MVFITQISLTYAICSTEFLKFNGGLTNQVMAHKHVLAIKGCTVNVQQDPRILILGRLAPHSPLTKVTTVRSCITLRFTSYNGPPRIPPREWTNPQLYALFEAESMFNTLTNTCLISTRYSHEKMQST